MTDTPQESRGSRTTIRRQLLTSSAVTAVATIALVAIAIAALTQVTDAKNEVISADAPIVADAYALDARVADRAVAVRDLVLTSDPKYRQAERAANAAFETTYQALLANDLTDTERQLLEQIATEKARWDVAVEAVLADHSAGLIPEGELGTILTTRLLPARQALDGLRQELVQEAEQVIAAGVDDSNRTADRAIQAVWLLGALILLLSVAIGLWIARSVDRRLTPLALTVSSAAGEILAAASQQAAGAAQQAAAVQETATTVEELVQTAEQSTDRARSVAEQATIAVTVAEDGRRAVDASTSAMELIRGQVTTIAATVAGLAEQAQAISDVTETVDDIARQTHMLALNASIEAARAGEHGRGFSVVASEVRALAEQSRTATGQVAAIISDIQQRTQGAVMATEEGTKAVDAGVQQVQQAGSTIQQLAETIASAALAAEQIAASAGQQSIATTQIGQAMQDLDGVMQHSVAGARQGEQAARDLDDVASRLQSLVGTR